MDEITSKELGRVLDLVSEDYVVHVDGRPIGTIELHERKHSTLERSGAVKENFQHRETKGTVNLISVDATTGPLADKQDSLSKPE